MQLRAWALASGVPLGVLAALGAPQRDALWPFAALSLAGAVLALLGLGAVSARGTGAPDQRMHLARGLAAGWAALPVALASAVGIGPPPLALAALCAAWLGLSLWRRSASDAPAPGALRFGLGLFGELALGAALAVGAGAAWAALDGTHAPPDAALRAGALDVDAQVALDPEPACRPRAADIRELTSFGAGPRLDADGARVWFEAAARDGRMQVHVVDRDTREVVCWTCGEPGNNRRPAPHPTGRALLFDTDRFATLRDPANSEVMAIETRGAAPVHPSRRLTSHPHRDDHAAYDPGGLGFAWTRDDAGRFRVMRASLRSGHGGFVLGELQELARGGASFVRLAAWSNDARSLAIARGHPYGAWRAELLDPATGEERVLALHLAPGPSVSFSADGSQIAVAEAATLRAGALVPSALGFVLARLPEGAAPRALHRNTLVFLGPTRGDLASVDLGEAATWGAPTGVALARDGRAFALGQRGPEAERIVWVTLDCEG